MNKFLPLGKYSFGLGDRFGHQGKAQLRAALAAMEGDDEIVYVEDAGAPNPFPIYGQAGQPCPRCGAAIAKLSQAGRTTWFCPGCQRGG